MGKFLYFLGYTAFKIYFKIVHRWEITGKENRPDKGSLIVMSNHISYLDPPIIGCIMNRQVYFMAKKELFKNPVVSWIFKKIGVFPVKRGKPDRTALRNAFKILKDGKVLGLFPEGTRHKSGKLGKAKAGAVMIALKSRTPILPVGVKNVYNDKPLKISIGKPFKLDKYYERNRKEAGDYIMKKIKQEIESL